ncbi:hypothetical protein PFMG_02972 [Plasmodium falciparum IGH-CR14]|uniref:OTU domain-containing protein n=1 Tax=Plasmodium falciparum IGH-CR14 TaxID=580059 RepID=A0A0L1IB73_PLAFA|nr:hypothetical protein PFMG_02972 [Plasmodium falciparum IGH-CR14]
MSKKKRANQQKRKKKTEKKKNVKLQNEKNYNNVESERGGITYSLINDYHDTNFKKNFYIKSIRTDGNCLFRAVSDQLYNHEENYKEIRKKVVEHLLKNEELYKNFIEYDESYKSYIERISLDGTWGGQLELQAVGEIYKVNILIYQENGCILEIKNHSDDNKCIQLHYASREHYNSGRFKNRALDNELKSILDLREILKKKKKNDSPKTFYETTENELTDENERAQSNNIKFINKKCDGNHREFFYNKLLKEEKNCYDYFERKKNGNNIFCFRDYEDDNNLTSYNVLQKIHNNIKINRKHGRSKSLPNINDKFLYFFLKNNRNDKVESDSPIDNLDERKKKDDEDFTNFYSEKILYNTENGCQDILYKNSYIDDNSISPNDIKNKKSFNNNYLYDDSHVINHSDINHSYYKSGNPFYSLYMKGDASQDVNNKINTFKNNDNINGNQINVYNMSVNNNIDTHQSTCKNNTVYIEKDIKCVNNLFNNKKEKHFNYYPYGDRIFNIIIDEYVISMESDFLCCYIGNKYNNILIRSKSNPNGKSEYNIDDNIYSTYATHIIENNNRNNEEGSNNDINTSNVNIENNNIGDSHQDNHSRNTTSTNITKDQQTILHLNSRDLSMKKKYQHKKFINMFSKDFYSKGLFQYLNADFILNDDKIKYIIPFFSNHNKINIFKKNIDSNDMYLYNYLMFYFYLNKDKILNKWKCSKNLYEEFLIKEKHKYYKFIKGKKYTSSIKSRDDQGVKIISI